MVKDVYTVLLVEDNPHEASRTEAALASAPNMLFDIRRARRLLDALDELTAESYDVILLDLSLPDSEGIETIKRIRTAAPRSALFVLTSLDNDELASQATAYGVHDYIIKDELSPHALVRAIRYGVRHHQVQLERDTAIGQLEAAKKALERKNRGLSDLYDTAHRFMDDVSHELRSPLTVIKEYCSIIQEGLAGPVNSEQRHYLDIVCDRVQDMNIMVNDMLDSSRLDAGLLGVRRQECQVDEIIEHVWAPLQRKASVKNVTLDREIADNLPSIYCDTDKAGRVLINLVINAIKCVEEGGKVRVWARRSDEGDDVIVGVTDNGPGIEQAQLDAIFTRFKQLKNGARDGTKGFGLGLNIAKELVRLNLGQISVESQVGRGATFTYTIPIADFRVVALRHITQLQYRPESDTCVVIDLRVEREVDESLADEVDAFLQDVLRQDDLLYRVDTRDWLLVAGVNPQGHTALIRRITKEWQADNQNRPHGPLPQLRHSIRALQRLRESGDSRIMKSIETILESSHA